jgi:predicted RNase H-like nuclease
VIESSCFIGIDLAWAPRNPTGVAALLPEGDRLKVAAAGACKSDEEITDFVREHMTRNVVVMIDAPLVLPNQTGMRPCDRLTHRLFGRQHAGAYPANRANMGRYNGGVPRGEALGLLLHRRLDFAWPPPDVREVAGRQGRFVFECYPHPAQVVLFGLDRTLKYKRKRQGLAAARAEFTRYLAFMRRKLRSPRIDFERRLVRELDVSEAKGRAYKEREDQLDAIFCAYLAALVPRGRMEGIGDPREGSIAVPTPLRP